MGRGPTISYHKDMMEGYVEGTLTCLRGDYIKKNINTDFPLVLNIEPTNACNLACYLCPRGRGARKIGYMSFDLFKKIIDECRSHKQLVMLNLHKDGESLLHPRIYDMIAYAKDAGVARTIHMNTNGLPLDEKGIKKLISSGIDDITVSIDAARPTTFEKIKGSNLLGEVESNVERILKMRNDAGSTKPFMRVKIMEFDDTRGGEIDEFVARWKGIADYVQVTGVHSWSGAIKGLRITDETKPVRFPCNILWYALAINWDGIVSACNVDWNLSAAVGDINRGTVHQVWNGDRIKKLRKAELTGDHISAEVCRDCVVWASGEDLTDWFRARQEFYV